MSKIKRWVDQRTRVTKSQAGEKISVADFLRELSPEQADHLENTLRKNSSFIIDQCAKGMSVLDFIEKYTVYTSFREEIQKAQPSNFHRSLLESSVRETAYMAKSMLSDLTISDLVKKVKTKDWNRVAKKNDEDAHLAVDAKPHVQQFPVHPEYSKMLKEDLISPHHELDENGISAKMVHEVQSDNYPHDQNLFMAKPYHKKIESATKGWVKNPILGWATMATKALFNAGNIGHLAEDVSTHEHEGVPLTVHKFADDHTTLGKAPVAFVDSASLKVPDIDPVDVHKIGVMDYLSNNLDRHHGNLMVGRHTSERGFRPILAIDHERNFQYNKPISYMSRHSGLENYDDMQRETPLAYIKGSPALKTSMDERNWTSHADLVDWWSQNGQKIRDEMENQLGSIKDESIRKHVRANFNDRWHKMNDWAKKMSSDPEGDDMYAAKSLGSQFQPSRIIPREQPRITSKQLRSLPKDKKDALFAISDIVNKKDRLTSKQRSLLSSAIENVIGQMTPEEAGDVLRSVADNPYMSTKAVKNDPDLDAKNRILRHFSEMDWSGDQPKYRYAHMNSIANAIDSMPEEKKEILKHWADHYRRILAERESKGAV